MPIESIQVCNSCLFLTDIYLEKMQDSLQKNVMDTKCSTKLPGESCVCFLIRVEERAHIGNIQGLELGHMELADMFSHAGRG